MSTFIPIVIFFILQCNFHQSVADLVSHGKTVEASSLYKFFYPENALDGNDVPYIGLGGCFVSGYGVNHWLKVDLGQEFDVTKVVIITAIDQRLTQYALQDAKVVVGNVGIGSDFGIIISNNSQCDNDITFEQLNTSSLLDVSCSPPIRGTFVFVTSASEGQMCLCEIFVYSHAEEATEDYLPLDPTGFWPLNSIYTIHDISGFRDPDTSANKVHFSNDSGTSIGFADLAPAQGASTSILIPNHGQIGVETDFALLFDIKPEPSSHGLILRVGDITVSQINSGNQVYASEIIITVNNTMNLSSVVFKPDIWTSIAIAYNGSTLSLWRNGYFVKAKVLPMPPISTESMEIGFDVSARGSIRNIHTYNRVLNQQEIMATFTIPSKENILLRTAKSIISNLYSAKSNLFRFVKSAIFSSDHVTADGVFVKTNQNCALLCFREILCNGYAFNKGSNHCVIGLEFVDEAELVDNQDWYFYIYVPKW